MTQILHFQEKHRSGGSNAEEVTLKTQASKTMRSKMIRNVSIKKTVIIQWMSRMTQQQKMTENLLISLSLT
jgi:hypothetical protein